MRPLLAGPSRLASAAAPRANARSIRSIRSLATLPSRPLASPNSRTPPLAVSASRRSFFSLPDISKLANLPQADGEAQRFSARKVMPYTPAQLYELVSDVPAYSYFLPFCTASTVLDGEGRPAHAWRPGTQPFTVHAELAVGFGGLEERYISKVVGTPFESVSATAAKSSPLFKTLNTTWSFKPTTPARAGEPAAGPTLLSIDLVFAFANPMHRIASQAVFPKVADKMVEAFETRAREVYGRR